MKNYWVYIMTNASRTVLYIGMTNNLARRISQHRAGEGSSFTKKYRTTLLVYYEHTTEVEAAIRREKQLKGWTRIKKAKRIEANNPEWNDLGDTILE